MSDVKRLVLSIVQFLRQELQTAELSSDAKESVEVAVQCLETAYGVSQEDLANESLIMNRPLLDIFRDALPQEHVQTRPDDDVPEPTEAQKAEAERFKQEGNNMMKLEMYTAALECYTKAISLDARNAVYYCNRAAAHSKLNNHLDAIEDCQQALEIDPKYGKAYGRIGLAYASLNQHERAKECYQKAVELDPENQSYINNLRVAEEKLREMSSQGNGDPRRPPGGPSGGGGGGLDFGSLLNNPTLMNMAATLMQDPNMQNIMSGLMSGGLSQNTGGGLDALLQAGQQLASQMQAANPELVEQLRRQMNNPNDPNSSNQDGNDRSN